ncbi:hypothetical protein SP28804_A0035 [Streptococcus pneumoniae CDC0288-04]|nr:hypothetical protein SP28804_A0035 [Streptococcus pneumoniae CDC0288-04]ELU61503.1 hypothetical protein PCS70012_02029 [Streptococcus pneumoniae PCS70012]ELU61898.1 hypothetical protein PNI0002_02044 [Streptococcus pneumoniae PNI0002]ELU64948.1 hypothetical protein PNI0006_02157 [Streptococcus pneumoniae PNI0006]ELU76161.1 hypothetical protein PNI0010_01680 [Streptococcus pneumoniae PNI0010]EMY90517.1 hypothetical protein PNI0197_00963 [Streptococcus pneumoniae PNI0197]
MTQIHFLPIFSCPSIVIFDMFIPKGLSKYLIASFPTVTVNYSQLKQE